MCGCTQVDWSCGGLLAWHAGLKHVLCTCSAHALHPCCTHDALLVQPYCRQLGVTLLELTAAGTALFNAMAALPDVVDASASGQTLSRGLSQAFKSLAGNAQILILLAQACGQEAAATEAARLAGRVLKLSAVSKVATGLFVRLVAAYWV